MASRKKTETPASEAGSSPSDTPAPTAETETPASDDPVVEVDASSELQGTVETAPEGAGELGESVGGLEYPKGSQPIPARDAEIVAALGPGESASAVVEGNDQLGELPPGDDSMKLHVRASPRPQCEKCTNERPCSVECWIAAGYPREAYAPFIAGLPPPPAPPPPPKTVPVEVWEHGGFKHDGKHHGPGAKLDLPPHIADVLHPVIKRV